MTSNQTNEIKIGIYLIIATVCAMIFANLDTTAALYQNIIQFSFGNYYEIQNHPINAKFFINECLMCVFFFSVGLELKHSMLAGPLKHRQSATLPLFGAAGGMIIPACLYLLLNSIIWQGSPQGWAIPTATDIAFAVSLLSVVKPFISAELRMLLLAIAIYDDLGAILIIALFYSKSITITGCFVIMIPCYLLYILNKRSTQYILPYLFLGIILFATLLVTGIHTTLAGVIIAAFIPNIAVKTAQKNYDSLLLHYQDKIFSTVNFFILPLFAFFNAGIVIDYQISLIQPISMGIFTGLVIGKPLGILLGCLIGQKLGLCRKPKTVPWRDLLGLGFLCGIGFTMSIFIAKLAFPSQVLATQLKVAKKSILLASIVSASIGLILLRCKKKKLN